MVALGCLLGVSAFWDKIKSVAGNIKLPKKPIVKEIEKIDPIDSDKDFIERSELVDVVEQWQILVEMCEVQDLHTAKVKLEEIFPLFVVKGGSSNEAV